MKDVLMQLKWWCFCSGYVPPLPQVLLLYDCLPPTQAASIHVFSVSGQDTQVPKELSQALMAMFQSGTAAVVEHHSGHYIPCEKSVVEEIKRMVAAGCDSM